MPIFQCQDSGGVCLQQTAVVAEGAAEIAAAQKHSAGSFARIIQQCEFLQALYVHKAPSFEPIIPAIPAKRLFYYSG